ncbi:MerR family transcriptional regulator [Mobilicoccus caccae]|uniref:MerR family transcriptional regulator n=1 Tax=Mobilicoccus caccae TaxID=1859295 RepID=A0ABQ6IMT1_9MICO|nr:MerR family transcriptional regulator [Mobilicoccus caccae]GMA38013.1 MerR family transcriptional regulator [Mobilicoccus caccae]
MAAWPAFGHAAATRMVQAVTAGDVDGALAIVDDGHEQLARDRATLDALRDALAHLAAGEARPTVGDGRSWSIGDLAHRLGVTSATLRSWERLGVLRPERDPATGFRVYSGADVSDADLAHLLRRGGYRLDDIAGVLEQIRSAGGASAVAAAMQEWRQRLTTRGLAMLTAAAKLGEYLEIAGHLSGAGGPPPYAQPAARVEGQSSLERSNHV